MNKTAPSSRPYQSPLRQAQAAQTRERIVAAAIEYLESNEPDTLSLPKVGEAAGVSVPTVYVHFPTLDALYLAIFEYLQRRIEVLQDEHRPDLSDLPLAPQINFPAYARHGKAFRALLLAPGFHRAQRGIGVERRQRWQDATLEASAGQSEDGRWLQVIAIHALSTPAMWLWLTETCGLATEEASLAASWATTCLVNALEQESDGQTRERTDPSDFSLKLRKEPASVGMGPQDDQGAWRL